MTDEFFDRTTTVHEGRGGWDGGPGFRRLIVRLC